MSKNFQIAASILSADFARLGVEIEAVLAAGVDLIHFDVMDNHYVANLTIGPLVCKALRDYGIKSPIDVHLMTKPVDQLIIDFAKAGADYLTIHPDATPDLIKSLQLINHQHCRAGVVLNPTTPVDCLDGIMHQLDMITIMSVNPGQGGQSFMPEISPKIIQVRKLIDQQDHQILLEVDGGIKIENIRNIALCGADILVIGSGLFKTNNYAETLKKFRNQLVV